MGDMAEEHMDQGQEAWWAHIAGRCDENCVYCIDIESGDDAE